MKINFKEFSLKSLLEDDTHEINNNIQSEEFKDNISIASRHETRTENLDE